MRKYLQGVLQKKAIDTFVWEALFRKSLNTVCIVFRFYNPKLSQEQCYKPYVWQIKILQGALQKKRLIASFVEDFEENHGNLINRCFIFPNYVKRGVSYSIYYVRLYTGHRIQEKLLITSFVEFFTGTPWKH